MRLQNGYALNARAGLRTASSESEWRLGGLLRIGMLLIALGILVGPAAGLALTSNFDAVDSRDEENAVAEAIAGHPASARRAALIASGYPEELLAIQRIQQRSASEFAALVSSYSQKEQEAIWNLVRYPGLVAELSREGRKSSAELERIASEYPEEVKDAILVDDGDHYRTLVRIYALDLEVEQAFFELLAERPTDVRDAFDEIIEKPDLLTLLIDNVHVATILGAAYREDPEGVEARFTTLHDYVLTQKRADELAWAEEVKDPEAAAELEVAAREFAEEYEYDVDTVDSTWTHTVYVDRYVYVRPYSYWFGYPYWYGSAYWYPRPVWSHVGFYFGGHYHGGYVSVGLPSVFFLNWYHGIYSSRHYGGHHYYRGDYANASYSANRRAHYYENHRPHYAQRLSDDRQSRRFRREARRQGRDSRRTVDSANYSGAERDSINRRDRRRSLRRDARRTEPENPADVGGGDQPRHSETRKSKPGRAKAMPAEGDGRRIRAPRGGEKRLARVERRTEVQARKTTGRDRREVKREARNERRGNVDRAQTTDRREQAHGDRGQSKRSARSTQKRNASRKSNRRGHRRAKRN